RNVTGVQTCALPIWSASAVKIFSRVRSRCSSRDPPMILGMPYCHTSARIDITLGWCHGSARRGTRAGTTAHLSPEYRTPAPWGRRPRERVTGIEPALSAWETHPRNGLYAGQRRYWGEVVGLMIAHWHAWITSSQHR